MWVAEGVVGPDYGLPQQNAQQGPGIRSPGLEGERPHQIAPPLHCVPLLGGTARYASPGEGSVSIGDSDPCKGRCQGSLS